MTQERLYWVCICLLAFPIGCSKSHQASTSVGAEVDAGDSQTDASENGESDSQAGGSEDARTNGDEEESGGSDSDEDTKKGGTGSNGGSSGIEFGSGDGTAGQRGGGSAGDVHYDRDDFEPYNEFTVLPIPRPVCPEMPPTEGTACADPGTPIPNMGTEHNSLVCGYGTSPRTDCRQIYQCKSDGTWGLNDSAHFAWKYSCEVPPEDACPETPTPGESCGTVLSDTVTNVVCEYEGLTVCTCSGTQALYSASGVSWQCFEPPSDSRCPPIMPNFGEGCEVQALECVYNDPCIVSGDAVFCRRGEWIMSDQQCLL